MNTKNTTTTVRRFAAISILLGTLAVSSQAQAGFYWQGSEYRDGDAPSTDNGFMPGSIGQAEQTPSDDAVYMEDKGMRQGERTGAGNHLDFLEQLIEWSLVWAG